MEVTATVGGIPAQVYFAGMTPGVLGLLQVNFKLPELPDGDAEIQVTIGGEPGNQPLVCVGR